MAVDQVVERSLEKAVVGDRIAKDALHDALASVAKALGNGRQAEIIDVLAQGERWVEDLAGQIDQCVANTSQHLQQLLRAGLVRPRRDGTRVFYSLAGDQVGALRRAMRDVPAEHVAQLDELADVCLDERTQLAAIGRDELAARLRAGDVVVLDVRPPVEYDVDHSAGAVDVPAAEPEQRMRDVPAGRVGVTCCRGPYCVYPDEAVRALSATGRTALRLVDGFADWAAVALPRARAV